MSVRSGQKNTDDVKRRITEAALENPKRGPRRLERLLKREEIIVSASTIYRVLRAENLHTREKRHNRAHRMPSKSTFRSTKTPPSAAVQSPPVSSRANQQPVFETLIPAKRSKRGIFVGMSGPISWGLRMLQAALVMLAMCLGVYAALQFNDFRNSNGITVADPKVDVHQTTPELKTAMPSLQNYRAVWKRDVFGTAAADNSSQRKISAVENIPRAPEDLGLKLVGTAATEIRGLSVAVVENSKTRTQEPFREGDRIGDLRIKKIMRSSVVLVTDTGEVLLAMGDGSGGSAGSAKHTGAAMADANITYAVEIVRNGKVTESYRTDQKWVTASLGNKRKMKRVRFLPHSENNRPDGLQVRMPTLHVLTRLGLRSSDVIQRINGQEATEPAQAAEAFNRLGEGEDLVIELLRSGEPWRVRVRAG